MRRLAAWVLVAAIPALAQAQILPGGIAPGGIAAGAAPVNDGSSGMSLYDDQMPDTVFQLAPIGLDRTVDPANAPRQIGGIPAQGTAAAHDDALGQIGGDPGGMDTGINNPHGNAN